MVTIVEIGDSVEVGSPIEIMLEEKTEFDNGQDEEGNQRGFRIGDGSFGKRKIIGYVQRIEKKRVVLSSYNPHNGKDLRLETYYVNGDAIKEYHSVSERMGF